MNDEMDDQISIMLISDTIYNTKTYIKEGGEIWTIHKTDVDPRPSNPHAHGSQGSKLDLSDGGLYKKTTYIGRIPKKQLIKIRWLFNAKRKKDEEKYSWLILPEMAI